MGRDSLAEPEETPLIGPDVIRLLWVIYDTPLSTKATLCRSQADEVAIAACAGLITVQIGQSYGRVWRITPFGLRLLWAAMNPMGDEVLQTEIMEDYE